MNNVIENGTAEFQAANQSGRELRRRTSPAVAARYDSKRARVVVELSSGVEVSFPARHAEGLQNATAPELRDIKITPSGLGLHFPKLDADLLPARIAAGRARITEVDGGKARRRRWQEYKRGQAPRRPSQRSPGWPSEEHR